MSSTEYWILHLCGVLLSCTLSSLTDFLLHVLIYVLFSLLYARFDCVLNLACWCLPVRFGCPLCSCLPYSHYSPWPVWRPWYLDCDSDWSVCIVNEHLYWNTLQRSMRTLYRKGHFWTRLRINKPWFTFILCEHISSKIHFLELLSSTHWSIFIIIILLPVSCYYIMIVTSVQI